MVRMRGQFLLCLMLVNMLSLVRAPQSAAQAKLPVAAQPVPVSAAQTVSSSVDVIPALPVPRLVKYSGVVTDAKGQPVTGMVGLSFSVYEQQEGGSPLWTETQNVQLDSLGRYTVLLGTTKGEGIPLDLFSSGDPRWLGVKAELEGEVEEARVLLVSVPYALKASDADTLGGKPASAYMLAPEQNSTNASATGASPSAEMIANSVSGVGHGNAATTTNYLAMFVNNSGSLGNSALFQNASGNIGLGYTNPTNARLVIAAPSGGGVLNSSNLVDQDMFVSLSAPGASDKHAFFGPSTNTNLALGVNNTEMMRITNTGNVGIGYSNPTNARLVIGAPKGGGVLNASNLVDQDMLVTLTAPGSTDKHAYFGPSTNTNLTLGVGNREMLRITNAGNVGIGTATPSAALEVNGTSKFDGNVTASGEILSGILNATTSFDLGGTPFAYGSYEKQSAFLGFAGNLATTSIASTAVGYNALSSVTTGNQNTAFGYQSLAANTSGFGNLAVGVAGLELNTTGSSNIAVGTGLSSNTTGSSNIAIGLALFGNTTGGNNTAVGNQTIGSSYAGNSNTAVGSLALYSNPCNASNNVAIGYAAGYLSSSMVQCGQGNSNTYLGANTQPTDLRFNNATAVGANAQVAASNAMVLGSINGVNGATASTNVGIGTTAPSNVYTVGQGAGDAIADGWDTYSSRRWKTNIKTLSDALSKVEHLRGVSYDLKGSGKHEVGVIAEEVGAVVPEVVSWGKNGIDAQGVDYGRLTALLIEATKEQQALIHQQQQEIARLRSQVKAIQVSLNVRRRRGANIRTIGSNASIVH